MLVLALAIGVTLALTALWSYEAHQEVLYLQRDACQLAPPGPPPPGCR